MFTTECARRSLTKHVARGLRASDQVDQAKGELPTNIGALNLQNPRAKLQGGELYVPQVAPVTGRLPGQSACAWYSG